MADILRYVTLRLGCPENIDRAHNTDGGLLVRRHWGARMKDLRSKEQLHRSVSRARCEALLWMGWEKTIVHGCLREIIERWSASRGSIGKLCDANTQFCFLLVIPAVFTEEIGWNQLSKTSARFAVVWNSRITSCSTISKSDTFKTILSKKCNQEMDYKKHFLSVKTGSCGSSPLYCALHPL